MDNWLQSERRQIERDKVQQQGLVGIYAGQISTVNPEKETVMVASHGGDKEYPVKHPYLATDSWIRVMPSQGSNAILQYRSDTKQPEIVNYANTAQKKLIDIYKVKKGIFRPLQPGELDFASKGLAESYFSRRSIRDDRAGIVRSWHDQDEAEHGVKAPIHRRVLHQNDSSVLGDEERLGVVKRPKDGSPNYNMYPKYDGKFAKEFFQRVLSVNDTPTILFEKWEGQVFDDIGEQIKHTYTNLLLRLKHNYYPNTGTPWSWEIDENGNSSWTLSDSATHGHNLTIPSGNLYYQIKKDWKTNVDDNEFLNVGKNSTTQIQKNHNIVVGENDYQEVHLTKTTTVGPADGSANYVTVQDSVNKQHVFSTPLGHMFIFDDADEQTITLIHKTGASIQFTQTGDIILQSSSGDTFTVASGVATLGNKDGSGIFVDDTGIQIAVKGGNNTTNFKEDSTEFLVSNQFLVNALAFMAKVGSFGVESMGAVTVTGAGTVKIDGTGTPLAAAATGGVHIFPFCIDPISGTPIMGASTSVFVSP